MQFVNIHGEPVTIGPPLPAKKRPAAVGQQYHKGWHVVGYSPDQLLAARLVHERGGSPKPFDPVAWMLEHKPLRVRSKPYELHLAARECAALATAAGWHDVRVVAKAKGN
ncbi:MAG TPA: hypothetical protein P5305_01445 [Rubrivivax sp.]|nr:hypothetical protein [Rubrivivax sp.]HRY86517.1 hypothetical protein [Rubrivivax sp.]